MKVFVSQEHIDIGRANDGNLCPIAHAIAEQHPNINKNLQYPVHVEGTTIVSTIKGTEKKNIRYAIPRSAKRFISAFDNGRPVKPFNFILTLLD